MNIIFIQQILPMVQISKPIFHTNPLKMLLNNNYSGTTDIKNLIQINKIYEIMRESIMQENNLQNQQQQNNLNNPMNTGNNFNMSMNNPFSVSTNTNQPLNLQGVTNIFTTVKPNSNKIFMAVKGQKIFNIIKDNNNNEQVINKNFTNFLGKYESY